MGPGSDGQEPSPPALLARRAAATAEVPWLVHRDALDWGWRSHARVADQVARGVDKLNDPGEPVAAGALPVVPSAHPDAIAAALAVIADGSPLRFADQGWWPPSCRRALDREPLIDLASRLDPAAADVPILVDGDTRRAGDLVADARRLIDRLPESLVAPKRGARLPIVTTGAGLPPATRLTVAVLTLLLDAVWAVEPQADAFASAVTWTRPTLVVATADELAALGAVWDRSNRRWSRLRAIVQTTVQTAGQTAPGRDASAEGIAETLRAPVVEWNASRHGAA